MQQKETIAVECVNRLSKPGKAYKTRAKECRSVVLPDSEGSLARIAITCRKVQFQVVIICLPTYQFSSVYLNFTHSLIARILPTALMVFLPATALDILQIVQVSSLRRKAVVFIFVN